MGGTDGQRKKLAFLVGFANGLITTLSAPSCSVPVRNACARTDRFLKQAANASVHPFLPF